MRYPFIKVKPVASCENSYRLSAVSYQLSVSLKRVIRRDTGPSRRDTEKILDSPCVSTPSLCSLCPCFHLRCRPEETVQLRSFFGVVQNRLVYLGGSKRQVIRSPGIAKSRPSASSTGIWQSPWSLLPVQLFTPQCTGR